MQKNLKNKYSKSKNGQMNPKKITIKKKNKSIMIIKN